MKASPAPLLSLVLLLPSPLLAQGSLDPPSGKPTPTMKSLEELWDQTDGLQTDVDRLDSKVDAITGVVAGLETQMTSLDRDVASLATSVGGLEAQVSALEAQNQALTNLLLSLGVHLGALPWEITKVDREGYVGYGASMALNPNGDPAIAYYDYDELKVRLAQYDGTTGEWQISQVASVEIDSEFSLSLAFAPNGKPAVAFVDTNADALVFAYYTTVGIHPAWLKQTVDATPGYRYLGQHCSLAYDAEGDPAISYFGFEDSANDGQLRYAVRKIGVWQVSTVDNGGVGKHSSLAFSPGGQPTIAYFDYGNDALKLAWHDGAVWLLRTVADSGDVEGYCSLAFTQFGEPAIAHVDGSDPFDVNLVYTVFRESETISATVDDAEYAGSYASLAFSSAGFPAICYHFYDNGKGGLRFASYTGSEWRIAMVESDVFPFSTSLLFLPNGQPAIAYSEIDSDELRFAVRTPFAAP